METKFKTDSMPKFDTIIADLHNLVKVLLKLKQEDKAQLIEILSILRKTPCNFEELGISADRYIKAIPDVYGTPGWDGGIVVGVMLLDMFARDPSELAVMVTLEEKDLQTFVKGMYAAFVDKYFAKCGPSWSLHQVVLAVAKLRLGGI